MCNSRTGQCFAHPGWEWAELDGERLVWAEAGKLFAGRIARAGLCDIRELQDFNAMRFERRTAPY